MADVVLSYAREDRARAQQVAQGLIANGLDVLWDNEIPPGAAWADHVEQKLAAGKAQIVLWSVNSTKSQWVREEARMGRDKGVLMPATIDSAPAPTGFGETPAADLSSWNGEADHPNWRRLLDGVRRVAGAQQRVDFAAPATEVKKKRGLRLWVLLAAAFAIITALAAGLVASGAISF